jgi:hypothetical protein
MSAPETTGRTLSGLLALLLAALGVGVSGIDAHVRNPPAVTVTASPSVGPTPLLSTTVSLPTALLFPDPQLHPGGISPGLTSTDLCAPGFTTKSIRPPTSYTSRLKLLELGPGGSITAPNGKTYTVIGENLPGNVSDYELDHLISLELGGNPVDPLNLWMQPWEKRGERFAPASRGAESKDVVENRLHREICAGTISLLDAQQEISTDWTTAR